MSEAEYIEAQNDVSEAIYEYGRIVQLVYNMETGDPWNPVQTPVERPMAGIVTSFSFGEIDGSLVMAQDKRILIARPLIEDMEGVEDFYEYFFNPLNMKDTDILAMKIKDNDTLYSIVGVNSVAPGNTVIMYKLQCRV